MLTHRKNKTTQWICGHFQGGSRNWAAGGGDSTPQVGFLQDTSGNTDAIPIPGRDGIVSAHIICYLCRQPGHYASVCPKSTTQFQGIQMQMNFSQRVAFLDNNEWGKFSDDDEGYDPGCQEIQHFMGPDTILINSGSTFNSFNSESLLSDVTSCDGMRAYSNGGSLDYHAIGSVNKFPTISAYFNPHSLANILSLANE